MRLTRDWCALVAGWIAIAAVVWAIPGTGKAYPLRILWTAGTTLLFVGWGAAIGHLVRRIVPPPGAISPPDATPPLPLWTMYGWFGAATVLVAQFSFSGLAAGMLILTMGTRIVYPPLEDRRMAEPREMFASQLAVSVFSTRYFAAALLIALGFQSTVVAIVSGTTLLAAALLSLNTAMLAALASVAGGWSAGPAPKTDRSLVSLACVVLMAILTVGVPFGGGDGDGSSDGEARSGTARHPQQADAVELPPPGAGESLPGDYPGVILWPETRPVTLLVDPIQAIPGALTTASRSMSIPFGGEYWMYRFPYPRPPANSHLRRGSPSMLSFRTTDSVRLRMEARQKLERPISFSCCSRIDLEIRNADKHPGTISIEVILLSAKSGEQTLGLARVTSIPSPGPDGATPVDETLLFRFPATSRLEWFDEIRTIFHTSYRRMDRSAQVSIERFRFVTN